MLFAQTDAGSSCDGYCVSVPSAVNAICLYHASAHSSFFGVYCQCKHSKQLLSPSHLAVVFIRAGREL